MSNSSLWFRTDTSKDEKDTSKIRQNVSFRFAKQTPKTLSVNKLSDDTAAKKQEQERIISVEDKEIKSSVQKEEKKLLTIAPIERNIWHHPKSENVKSTEEPSSKKSINDLAVEELLKESAVKNAEWENREAPNISVTIPMVIQNKLPKGFETDEKLDVALRASDSTLDDYENVPVTDFGFAVLRGMGVNPGDPIGNKNKKFVEPIEAVLRSKGLGLGAESKIPKKSQSQDKEEELKLMTNAYVRILLGAHKGSYGQVNGLDESRVIVKLDEMDKNVSMPALYVEVISKKEFQKERKVINKDSYDKYKEEDGHKNKHSSRDESTESGSTYHNRTSENGATESYKHSKREKRKHSKERESHKKHSNEQDASGSEGWVRPQLKVRFIDQMYKKGKYFNQKLIVEDVVSSRNCICKTEEGKYLEELKPSMLETVIPRAELSHVMIVRGVHKTQLGTILDRDKKNCVATVQLLSDRSKVVKLDYDCICEYVGDVSLYD